MPRTNGLDLETVRAGIDRLIAEGVLPGPQPSDAELLASIGIDLEAVAGRLKETFGHAAYRQATQRVKLRRTQPASHRAPPGRRSPATRRSVPSTCCSGCSGTPRTRSSPSRMPASGPHALRLLVEARGLTLEALRSAVRRELDRPA